MDDIELVMKEVRNIKDEINNKFVSLERSMSTLDVRVHNVETKLALADLEIMHSKERGEDLKQLIDKLDKKVELSISNIERKIDDLQPIVWKAVGAMGLITTVVITILSWVIG